MLSLDRRALLAFVGCGLYLLGFAILGGALFMANAFPNHAQRLMYIDAHSAAWTVAWLSTTVGALLVQPLVLALPRLMTGAPKTAWAGSWILFGANLGVGGIGLVRGLRIPALAHVFATDPAARTEAMVAFYSLEGRVFGADVYLLGLLAAVSCALLARAAARTKGAPRGLVPLLWLAAVGALLGALEEVGPLHTPALHPSLRGAVHDYNYFAGGYALFVLAAVVLLGLWALRSARQTPPV